MHSGKKADALEYANQKIRINSIGPAYIMTPLITETLDDTALKALVGLHPIGRLGTSEEVAELALWLASDKASFVTVPIIILTEDILLNNQPIQAIHG